MSKSRTKKSIRNSIYALGAQFITTLLAFITRTVMVKTVGIDAISLNSLFSEVIEALALAELGIGSAIAYNLYRPLAEGNKEKICQLMTLYKDVYRIIALVTFVIGLIICPFIQYIVNDIGYSISYIRFIYVLFVIQISSSYLFTYKITLLNADQNRHLYSLIVVIVKIIGTIAMISSLYITNNYVIYLFINIFMTIGINIVASCLVDRMYPYLHKDKNLPTKEKRKVFDNVKNIFIKQLSGKITNSTDNILISVLVSTIYVGYYSFYAIIINTFKSLLNQVDESIYSSIGNLFATEDNERCLTVLFRLTWLYGSFSTIVCTCIYICMEPFISLWVGSSFILPHSILTILCINLFAYMTSKPIYAAMHVSGFFKEGRNISIAGSTVNLFTSIIFGIKLGMLGIFIGTFMTYLIQIILKIRDMYKLRFKVSALSYVYLWLESSCILVIAMFSTYFLCSIICIKNNLIQFLVNGVIGLCISLLSIVLISFRREEMRYTINLLKSILKRNLQ